MRKGDLLVLSDAKRIIEEKVNRRMTQSEYDDVSALVQAINNQYRKLCDGYVAQSAIFSQDLYNLSNCFFASYFGSLCRDVMQKISVTLPEVEVVRSCNKVVNAMLALSVKFQSFEKVMVTSVNVDTNEDSALTEEMVAMPGGRVVVEEKKEKRIRTSAPASFVESRSGNGSTVWNAHTFFKQPYLLGVNALVIRPQGAYDSTSQSRRWH